MGFLEALNPSVCQGQGLQNLALQALLVCFQLCHFSHQNQLQSVTPMVSCTKWSRGQQERMITKLGAVYSSLP